MSGEPYSVPQPNASERLFEFVRDDHVRVRFELRDNGGQGTEVQVFHDDVFVAGYRHPSRELAIVWAVQERTLQAGGGGAAVSGDADDAEKQKG